LSTIYDFTVTDIDGRKISTEQYRGRTLLIVNAASKYLTSVLPGKMGRRIKWNFTKFLMGPYGSPVQRYAPADRPLKIIPDIEELLGVQ